MKITNLQFTGTWESKFGLLYQYDATLDDGRTGRVNCKTKDAWKVGDEVEVQVTEGNYGTSFKLSRPQMESKSQSSPEVQKRIDASWAIGQAIQYAICQEFSFHDDKELVLTARKMLDLRNSLLQ